MIVWRHLNLMRQRSLPHTHQANVLGVKVPSLQDSEGVLWQTRPPCLAIARDSDLGFAIPALQA